ncbi:hypothetical protein Droror1_Dr00002999 [Drosera rotundifolia]
MVLGCELLTELRDKICCLIDGVMQKTGQHDPSGYFLVEPSSASMSRAGPDERGYEMESGLVLVLVSEVVRWRVSVRWRRGERSGKEREEEVSGVG